MKKFLKIGCLGLIALIALIIVIVIFSSGGDDEEVKDSGNNEEENEDVETAKIGVPAEVADVTFTVNEVKETDLIESGNEFIDNAETSGKFVILDVNVENDTDETMTVDSSYFTLITDEGTENDPITSGEAIMALSEDAGDFFLEQINPGLEKDGKLVFEVSEDVDVSKSIIEASTGMFGTESIEISLTE